MEPEIIFVPSAFKHKVTEADIRNAYKTRVYDRLIEGCDNKYGFIGFNPAGFTRLKCSITLSVRTQ
jgi:hypothetical protein